jgi:uncharacterized membrane protein
MKILTCEICGSNDLVKSNGLFVCNSCGCKYSVEEAKNLMIEGNIDISGTIKIDNTEKIKKLMVNAKRAYDNSNMAQAQTLYGQILNEEPDNAEAILYQGLAIGWQGNTVRYTIEKTANDVVLAIDVAYKKYGDSPEFEDFILKATDEMTNIGMAMARLCQETLKGVINDTNSTVESVKRRSRNAGIYGDFEGYKREGQAAIDRMNEASAKYSGMINYTMVFVTFVFSKVVDKISDVTKYKSDTYTILKERLSNVVGWVSNEDTATSCAVFIVMLDNYISNQERKREENKKKAIAEYWAKHKSEKDAFDLELKKLNNEKVNLMAEITKYNYSIEELNKKQNKKLPDEERVDFINEEITKLNTSMSKLGLFKGKEKKAISAEIDNYYNQISDLQANIKNQKADIKSECMREEYNIKKQMQPTEIRINEIDRRIAEINNELNKERE